jgi:hypothetical protein
MSRGMWRFETRVPQFLAALPPAVNRALNRIGIHWSAQAKQACPVDTGRLRASTTFSTPTMRATVTPMGGEPFTPPEPPPFTVQVGTNVEYGPAVHEGVDAGTTISVPRHTVRAHTRKTKHGAVSVREHERGPYEYASRGRAPNKYIEGPGTANREVYVGWIIEALQSAEGGEP